jgi:plasmid stability protein
MRSEPNKTQVCVMNEITIRNLDNACVQRLRQLAWQDGRSMEEVVRSLVLEGARSREFKRPDARFPVPTD